MTRLRPVDMFFNRVASDGLVIEQFRSLRPQVPIMYIAILVNLLFLSYVATPDLGSRSFILTVVVAALITIRSIQLVLTRNAWRNPTVAQMRASMTVTLVIAFVLSLTLNVWGIMLGNASPNAHIYVALFTALCTICCAACLSSLPLAAYIVVAIGTIPVSVALILTDDTMLMSMGANILLVSPLVIGMIQRQQHQLCRMVESRSDIAAEKIKVSDMAYRDSLTGLANRRAFLDALADAKSSRPDGTLAIGMIDLDGFKIINDTYGHRTGDELLVETADRFRRLDRGDATIARLGGDEFAVLLRDANGITDAHARLAHLARVFADPFVVGGHIFRLRASIGLAWDEPGLGIAPSLISRADLAMYEAKRTRSTEICVFQPEMEARARRLILVEQALASHDDNELIELYYQPIVAAESHLIVGFEALARWNHPTLGVISPSEFIPLAEHAGITNRMTMHLLAMALRAAATWPPEIGLSFNLSAAELNSPALAGQILQLVAEHHFDPRRLSIEVTETSLLADFATARSLLTALRHGGIRILLDDFGAGYASIGYLRQIQFDGIKLDGSLIALLLESPAAHNLLIGVLDLCRAIGAPVTAEMVETAAQRDMLCALSVEKLQGHYLSQPLTTEEALLACADDYRRTLPFKSTVVTFAKRPTRA